MPGVNKKLLLNDGAFNISEMGRKNSRIYKAIKAQLSDARDETQIDLLKVGREVVRKAIKAADEVEDPELRSKLYISVIGANNAFLRILPELKLSDSMVVEGECQEVSDNVDSPIDGETEVLPEIGEGTAEAEGLEEQPPTTF